MLRRPLDHDLASACTTIRRFILRRRRKRNTGGRCPPRRSDREGIRQLRSIRAHRLALGRDQPRHPAFARDAAAVPATTLCGLRNCSNARRPAQALRFSRALLCDAHFALFARRTTSTGPEDHLLTIPARAIRCHRRRHDGTARLCEHAGIRSELLTRHGEDGYRAFPGHLHERSLRTLPSDALEPVYSPARLDARLTVSLPALRARPEPAARRPRAARAGRRVGRRRLGQCPLRQGLSHASIGARAPSPISSEMCLLDVGSNRGSFAQALWKPRRTPPSPPSNPTNAWRTVLHGLRRAASSRPYRRCALETERFDVVHSCHTHRTSGHAGACARRSLARR